MSELMRSQAIRNAQALQHAQEIKQKVEIDNSTGWYRTQRLPVQQLEVTNDYLLEGAALLQKAYGQKLTAYLVGLERPSTFGKWLKGEEKPNQFQSQRLRTVIEVTEILLTVFTHKQAKAWWTTPNDYMLYWLPLDEIAGDAALVRNAALFLLV